MRAEPIAHPVAIDHIPSFITAPGQSDMLFNVVIIFLLVVIFLTGVLYLRLHALPDQMAHKTNKVQLQLVAVLGLIALLTHNQLFWIAALLLAMTDLPDFVSPVTSMARSLDAIARKRTQPAPQSDPSQTIPPVIKDIASSPAVSVSPVVHSGGLSGHGTAAETSVIPDTSTADINNGQEQK
ncbi:hypothetical protein OIV19_23125 [Brucella sp. HL-2]|nr:hypothetical protein [Brucella sp. HL-2]MCV9910460.1 hypothetical protein [Brucella sp. HL-2]